MGIHRFKPYISFVPIVIVFSPNFVKTFFQILEVLIFLHRWVVHFILQQTVVLVSFT